MSQPPLNSTHTVKPYQIQANMIGYMRLFAGLPDVVMVDTQDLFWIVSHGSAPGNMILRTRWSGSDIEERIDALFAEIGRHIDHIDWMLYPGDQPLDLGNRLEARGMPPGLGGNWLWCDLASLSTPPTVSPDFHIKPVRDDAMLAEWIAVSQAGFGENLQSFRYAYGRHGYGDDAFSLHFTGYLGETPVTTGTILDADGTASIYDVSTPPDLRGQGFGGAITHALMQKIRDRGYADTWIWSSNMAKSLYQKLGYIDTDFGMREHSWHRVGT